MGEASIGINLVETPALKGIFKDPEKAKGMSIPTTAEGQWQIYDHAITYYETTGKFPKSFIDYVSEGKDSTGTLNIDTIKLKREKINDRILKRANKNAEENFLSISPKNSPR